MPSFVGFSFSLASRGTPNASTPDPDLFDGWVDRGTLKITGPLTASFHTPQLNRWIDCSAAYTNMVYPPSTPRVFQTAMILTLRDLQTNGKTIFLEATVDQLEFRVPGRFAGPTIVGSLGVGLDGVHATYEVSGIGYPTPPPPGQPF